MQCLDGKGNLLQNVLCLCKVEDKAIPVVSLVSLGSSPASSIKKSFKTFMEDNV